MYWLLAAGNGDKAVFARFSDTAGNLFNIVSDTIELTTAVPAAYGMTMNAGDLYTNKVTVTLTIGALPGTAEMQISNDGGFANIAWEPYRRGQDMANHAVRQLCNPPRRLYSLPTLSR